MNEYRYKFVCNGIYGLQVLAYSSLLCKVKARSKSWHRFYIFMFNVCKSTLHVMLLYSFYQRSSCMLHCTINVVLHLTLHELRCVYFYILTLLCCFSNSILHIIGGVRHKGTYLVSPHYPNIGLCSKYPSLYVI